MSPEQANGGEVDRRSDIFSFGAVLYEMISGRRAFKGEDAKETMSAIMHKDPEPIRLSVADISASVEAIITRTLAKDPSDRYQTVRDLHADLRTERRRIERADAADAANEARPLQPKENGHTDSTTEKRPRPGSAAADQLPGSFGPRRWWLLLPWSAVYSVTVIRPQIGKYGRSR